MEVAAISVARQLEHNPPSADPVSVRVRNADRMTISASLRQVAIERMALVGRPQEAQVVQFLQQLERSDADVVVNMVKVALRVSVRSYRYVINRFRFMVRAARCIRVIWQASRFRFAVKLQRLIVQWRRDEDEARRKLLSRSKKKPVVSSPPKPTAGSSSGASSVRSPQKNDAAGEDDGVDDDFVLQQFISLQAPVELKRRVLMKYYHMLAKEFRLRWRAWRAKSRELECAQLQNQALHQRAVSGAFRASSTQLYGSSSLNSSSLRGIKEEPQQCEMTSASSFAGTPTNGAALLSSSSAAKTLTDVPREPRFDWFDQLSKLTAAERFEMCLQYQLRRGPQQLSALADDGADDGWITLSLAAVTRHARQIEERAAVHYLAANSGNAVGGRGAVGPSITYIPRYTAVKSKVMDAVNAVAMHGAAGVLHRRVNRYGDVETTLPSSSSAITATRMTELKAELPTLAKFKCDSWSAPPRPQGHATTPFEKHQATLRRKRATSAGAVTLAPEHHMHRRSETPAMSQLDPFAKSLVLRGVLRPPARPSFGSRASPEIERCRGELMSSATVELSSMYHHTTAEDLIRAERFRQMVLYNQKSFGVK